jgi:hypothetical protein
LGSGPRGFSPRSFSAARSANLAWYSAISAAARALARALEFGHFLLDSRSRMT